MSSTALRELNDVMQRSMLTGVPTTEYNAALAKAGFSPDQWWEATQALQGAGYDTGKPTDQNILKYGQQIADQGYGNMSYAVDSDYYQQAQDNTVRGSRAYQTLQQQLNELQARYDTISGRNRPAGGGGTTGGGAGVVDDGSSLNSGAAASATSGPVWGPDGRMFSSVAAALAAGVTNYSFQRPQQGAGLINSADALSGLAAAATGNANPGSLISGANSQLFTRQTGAQVPAGVRNPFAIT